MIRIRPRRSVLFMPATNARALAKARTLPADVIVIDLEDAVAPEAKAEARERLRETVLDGGFGDREVVARINPPTADLGQEDMRTVGRLPLDGMLLPKVEHEEEIATAHAALSEAGAPDTLGIWLMIETPRGVLAAERLCAVSSRLRCLALGTSDLATDLRVPHTPSREGLLHALSHCVLAARANGLDVLDGVHLALDDPSMFRRACEQGRVLGFDGKTLIHPSQIADANDVFSPSATDVSSARALLDAWKEGRARGQGMAVHAGKLVEHLHAAEVRGSQAHAQRLCLPIDVRFARLYRQLGERALAKGLAWRVRCARAARAG